ncbi:hypothetical protein [Litchfieldia alkalitelluris]|nr:hypothetical protein [Litchfieldia alkalitelluris]
MLTISILFKFDLKNIVFIALYIADIALLQSLTYKTPTQQHHR